MFQSPLSNFQAMNSMQYAESYTPGPSRTGLIRSASTSCAIINSGDQPRPPPRRRKRGESLGSDQLGSANSSQYSLVNYPYNENDPNVRNTNTIKQMPAWTPNSTLRRHMSSDMAVPASYNRHFNAIGNQLMNNYNEQMQKPVGVLEQVINRSMPTPPPRLSSAKNTLRRRSYVENLVSTFEAPAKPLRQKLQSGLNQSQFDIPGTPITTHLPPQSVNRFVSTPTRPSTTLSSINLSQTANLVHQPPPTGHLNRSALNNPALSALQATMSKNNLNKSNTNLDYHVQPFYNNKTMSLDNLHAAALKQNLRRSPTREELFDYIVAQQEQLAELKTQQKVLEKQVDIAHKEAAKAHHHHHHRRHRHHKANRSKERDNLDNSIDSSSMISSERRSKSHHHRSKVDKNLTAEANKQVHDHIKQLQEQLELIRQKRRKIKSDKSMEPELDQIDRELAKSNAPSAPDGFKERTDLRNSGDKENKLLRPPAEKSTTRGNQTGNSKEDDLHNNRLSPIPTPLSSNRSPLGSRSSSIERAITKRELLRESAKEKWNRSFMEDLADDQLIKELSKSPANQDILKELLPKISINTDDKNRNMLNYNEILEKNLKLNPPQNWLTDPLDEYTYSERSPIEPLSPFGGRTGVFRPISADDNVLSPSEDKSRGDLLTGEAGYQFPSLQVTRGVDRKETSSPIPRNYFQENNIDNIEGYINQKANNLITGDIDLLGKGNRAGNLMMNSQQAMNDHMMSGNSMTGGLMASNVADNTMTRNGLMASKEQEQQFNLLKKQEEQLIERLENELMNEKVKQKELMDKKNEIERRQIDHEIELEKTKRHLLEQQSLFQEQQQLLQNQRQEIEIERWRMEQEKNQLKHEHEMNTKRDQFEQQKVLNQQLEQQRRAFDQQLQSQKVLQEQLQKELEHQRQLQIKNQQQSANALNAALSSSQQQPSVFAGGRPAQQPASFFNDSQLVQPSVNLRNLPSPPSMHPPLQQTAAGQPQMSLNPKKSPLTSPLQSLQSLLPHALQPKSLQNALQQQSQLQSQQQFQVHNQLPNEPSKPRRHRLGQEDHSHQFSAFKPPPHSNSKLNLIDSPKSSFNAINAINQITTPFISTEQRAPSPRPPLTSNPGMLSSTSSLTRQQPVGLMSSFASPGGQQFNNRSREQLNRSRQNFFGSGELDQSNKTNQYFGSGGNLNLSRTEMNFTGNTNFAASNYNNKNLSTGSLHLAQQQQQQKPQDNRLISGQPKPKTHSREQFRMGLGYQQDQYDQRQYSSHTNLNANQHSYINGPRRNSVMDPFRDHFDQYFTPKKQATTSTSNLKPPTSAASHKVSSLSTTNAVTSVSPTLSPALSPALSPGLSPSISPALGNTMNMANTVANSSGLKTSGAFTAAALTTNDATQGNINNNLQASAVNRKEFGNRTKDALLDPLDKLNENKDSLAEYQGLNPNRRLTLPELPRALETATSNEQIKGYAVSKPKGDLLATTANVAVRRKNSLPENVKSAAAVIKPGWNREEVSVLAHEAREAKAKAAELTGTQVTVMKLKDWFVANLFVISLVVFNLSIFYVYLQLMQPLDEP